VSTGKVRQRYRIRAQGGHLWSASYLAASCAGAPLSIIKQYIEQQRTPDC
jgi:putative transposase